MPPHQAKGYVVGGGAEGIFETVLLAVSSHSLRSFELLGRMLMFQLQYTEMKETDERMV